LPYVQDFLRQIHIPPLQTKQLAAADARFKHNQNFTAETMHRRVLFNQLHLLGCVNRFFFTFFALRQPDILHRILTS
jgi:hypothetical protein